MRATKPRESGRCAQSLTKSALVVVSASGEIQFGPGEQVPGTVYRVVEHLATGGMGTVYDVEDITVGKRYVLKTLHPQLVSRVDLARRMEVEARALATLQHPNIVDVVTAGVTNQEPPTPFYVMERLNGQNLRVVLERKGPLGVAHGCVIAIAVLEALAHAHEHGVIHRDVKPDNIFLHRTATGATVIKLLDFGILRLIDRNASETHGHFLGTPRYASPEQVLGAELGPAADLYSLGLVLYEMLAGRGPFDDIRDVFALGVAHAQRPPPPPSTWGCRVPEALEMLIMRSLSKDPAGRPVDATVFAAALQAMLQEQLNGQAPQALRFDSEQRRSTTPPAASTSAITEPGRPKKLIPALTVAAIALLVLLAVGWFVFRDAPAPSVTPTGTHER